MNIGEAIKRARKRRNMKQFVLAESCGISNSYLSQIENGNRDTTLSTLSDISRSLNIPIQFLLFDALDDSDISEAKREVFGILNPILKSIIESLSN